MLVEFGAVRGGGYALSTVVAVMVVAAVAVRNRCWAACFVVP